MNITTKEVIRALGISKSTFYRWKRQGIVEQKIKEKAKLLELMEQGQALQKRLGKRVAPAKPQKNIKGGRYAK
jgi:transposase-like protein